MADYDINEERGEVGIRLDGKLYPMRPSFTAMLNIERKTGRTLVSLSASFAAGRFGGLPLEELAIIVVEGIHAAGAERNEQMLQGFDTTRVAEHLFDGGLLEAMEPIDNFLKNALTGGSKPKKKKALDVPKGETT